MDYKKYNDYELVYQVRESDEVAQGILFDKYLPLIKSLASNAYRQYDCYGYDFDDFLQEAYIGFQKAVVNFNENNNNLFYTFVVVCIKRHLSTFCRNISNTTKNIANYNLDPIEEVAVVDGDSDTRLFLNQSYLIEAIKNLIYSLSFECACILELKINGFTYNEIGILLDIPSSTAEYKNRRPKKLLFKILKDYKF